MATACLIMAFTPEYKEIGITATIMVMVARVLQGFSSMGEIKGAQLYLTEFLAVPYKCMAAGVVAVSSQIGGLFALMTTSIVLSSNMGWRWAFGVGAFVAVFGLWARTGLRETPEFTDHKLRIADKIKQNKQDVKDVSFDDEKVDKKTVLAYFFTEFHAPICFCIAYNYSRDFMKKSLEMTPVQVISHNLKVAIFAVIGSLIIIYLVKKYTPLK